MTKSTFLKKAALSAFALTCCLFISKVSNATHIAGAELTYQHLTGNTYKISLTLYRDCAGNQIAQFQPINIQSASCSQSFNLQVNQEAGTGGEITFPCASGGTTCTGGTSLGVQKYVYSNTTTLPANCTDWVFSWSQCCRNCAINTTVHGNCASTQDIQSNIYLEARLNNSTVSGNNSPTFSVNPVATMCLGQNFSYNHGVVDTDGDLLVYHLIGSQVGPTTTVTYQPGYSPTNPINSVPALMIDSTTGDLNMTPQLVQTGVMAVRVDEYRSGVWVGSVMRDLQFVVQNCTNTLPSASGINGTAAYDTTICPGTNLCFYIFVADPDAPATQMVSLSSTSNAAIPGSSFNNSGGSLPTGAFCWTPTQADARMTPWTFIAKVRDDACPTNGLQSYAFSILIPYINPTLVSNDATGSVDVSITGNTGGYTYLWSNGATTEDVAGLAPGTYSVTICEQNGCCITRQATINPIVNCSITIGSQVKQPTCGGTCNGWIKITPHGIPPYTYQWSNGETTRLADSLCAGTYTATVTDSAGCTHTCTYTLHQPNVLNLTCTASNTCYGAEIGDATVAVVGGSGTYTYAWDNGETTQTISDLCAGTYCVTVSDAGGCVANCCATVASFQAIGCVTKIVNASSLSACDGKYSAVPSSGTAPYTFTWSTGAVATGVNSDSITGLCPGTYYVIITDANGCVRKLTKVVGPLISRFLVEKDLSASSLAKIGDDQNIIESAVKSAVIPNPFNSDFTIQSSSNEAMQVYIYNMSGALVRNYENILPGERIGTDLSDGLYILQIQQAGEVFYQRIAKQNQ